MASKISAINTYNVIVNNGRLESITLKGIAQGLKISTGLIYNFNKNLGANFSVRYNIFPKVKVNEEYTYITLPNAPKVDFNGFEIGVSIYIRK